MTEPLLRELGFREPLVNMTQEWLDKLALPPDVTHLMVSHGPDALRAVACEVTGTPDMRASISRVAKHLTACAPQMLWLVAAVDSERGEIAVAACDTSRSKPKVVALLARRDGIVDSDSETVCALASANGGNDVLTHLRWLEILGRDSVGRRFFRELERLVVRLSMSLQPAIDAAESSELSLLYVSRLLFLSFLETKGWLDNDYGFLGNRYADCMATGGGYHQRVLSPLFFGTLNTHPRNRAARARSFGRVPFLNGGLFARSALEARTRASLFSDEALGDVFGDLLTRYRFTAREDSTAWSEAAIDPEMLGKAFESLMSAAQRKSSGAFYTPQSLVSDVSRSGLARGLASHVVPQATVIRALTGETLPARERNALLASITAMRVLDPACGSGSFLVHILEELAALRFRLGDTRSLHTVRREILTRSIFGVDINPTAVWLCELRLWLSMAIEDPERDPMRVTPLPNLDRNIRIGDSLSGEAFRGAPLRTFGAKITSMRRRYSRSTGPRKKSLARQLDRVERECALAVSMGTLARLRHERREIISLARARDLFGERRRPPASVVKQIAALRDEIRNASREAQTLTNGGALPFSFLTGFADVGASGGFNVIAGNPPWVRTHNLDSRMRLVLKQGYSVYRNSAWASGSETAAAGRGFGSQVDVAALFIERCTDLLIDGGAMALLVPAKLWHSLAGGGVRGLLGDRTTIHELHDLSNVPHIFDAAVYPSVIVATRNAVRLGGPSRKVDSIRIVSHRDGQVRSWTAGPADLAFDDTRGSPWLLVPADVRRAFKLMMEAGSPFARSLFGRPLLGVKTGCNAAFLVTLVSHDSDASCRRIVESADRKAEIEESMLRPAVRGDRVRRWEIEPHQDRLIWTHDPTGAPLRTLPPQAGSWLTPWRTELERRTDAHSSSRWWSLFRTEGAECSGPRVVWADIGKRPRAAILAAGDPSVPLNTCYVARCPHIDDALALAALLNSSLAAAWLGTIAEPARGGFKRYLGWTMSLLPVPHDWERARAILAPYASRALINEEPTDSELCCAATDAYQLTSADVSPLLQWNR